MPSISGVMYIGLVQMCLDVLRVHAHTNLNFDHIQDKTVSHRSGTEEGRAKPHRPQPGQIDAPLVLGGQARYHLFDTPTAGAGPIHADQHEHELLISVSYIPRR